jgi:hypothetical protein
VTGKTNIGLIPFSSPNIQMWLKHRTAQLLVRYLRGLQRYVHHAVMEGEWKSYHAEYVYRHRSSLMQFLAELNVTRSGPPPIGVADMPVETSDPGMLRFGYELSMYLLRSGRNTLLGGIGMLWVRDDTVHSAIAALTMADIILNSPTTASHNSATPVTQLLGYLRWQVGFELCGARVRDTNDILPTDDGECDAPAQPWVQSRAGGSPWEGRLRGRIASGCWSNWCCHDRVRIDLLVTDGIVQTARFWSVGCTVSRAASALVCETSEGRSVSRLAESTPELLLPPITGLTMNRRACAKCAYFALRSALDSARMPKTDASEWIV